MYGAVTAVTKKRNDDRHHQHQPQPQQDEKEIPSPSSSRGVVKETFQDEEEQEGDGLIPTHHRHAGNNERIQSSRPWHGIMYHHRCPLVLLLTFLLLVILLLMVDVTIRTMSSSSNSNSITKTITTTTTSSTAGRRWEPKVDLLYNSSNNLKYTWDVGNYSLQGLAFLDTTTTMMNVSTGQDRSVVTNNNDSNNSMLLLYEVHTLSVRVLELVYNRDDDSYRLRAVRNRRTWMSDDFPMLMNNMQVKHIGGIDLCRRRDQTADDDDDNTSELLLELWLATHSDGIDGVGGLIAVDPDTLSYREGRKVLVDYNLDWVACTDNDNMLYFGTFFNVKQIHRVDLDTLKPLPSLAVDFDGYPQYAQQGINYVQSASFDGQGRLVLLGDDYQNTIYVLDIPQVNKDNSRVPLSSTQGLLLGSETDGITFDKDRNVMFVGYNRQHSHEQVMGMDQMISIVEFEQQ